MKLPASNDTFHNLINGNSSLTFPGASIVQGASIADSKDRESLETVGELGILGSGRHQSHKIVYYSLLPHISRIVNWYSMAKSMFRKAMLNHAVSPSDFFLFFMCMATDESEYLNSYQEL